MAGIYSQGGSAGHRYAGWLSKVEAKNFHFGGKVFNGSPSAIYVGSKMVWANWLKAATKQAIMAAFGVDGPAVIAATNEYLNGIAASDKAKATALAGFINTYAVEDAHIVYSLIPTLGVRRMVVNGTRGQYFDLGITPSTTKYEIYVGFESKGLTIFGNQKKDIMVYASQVYYSTNSYMNWPSTLVNNGFHEFYGKYDGSFLFDIDGHTETKTGTLTAGATIKAFYNTGYPGDAGTGSIEYMRSVNDNVEVGWFVPFIRENNVELLNLVTGTLAERHGTFTISETPTP